MPTKSRKICLLGYPSSGKTSLLQQFLNQSFSSIYDPTLETTITTNIKLNHQEYEITLLDIGGQMDPSLYPQSCFVNIHGYLIVYSIANYDSFMIALSTYERIQRMTGKSIISNTPSLYNSTPSLTHLNLSPKAPLEKTDQHFTSATKPLKKSISSMIEPTKTSVITDNTKLKNRNVNHDITESVGIDALHLNEIFPQNRTDDEKNVSNNIFDVKKNPKTSQIMISSSQNALHGLIGSKQQSDSVINSAYRTPVVFVGNKLDLLAQRTVSKEMAKKSSNNLKVPLYETSAKTNHKYININKPGVSKYPILNRRTEMNALYPIFNIYELAFENVCHVFEAILYEIEKLEIINQNVSDQNDTGQSYSKKSISSYKKDSACAIN